MKRIFMAVILLTAFISVKAQDDEPDHEDSSWTKIYRATATRFNDLVHTRLDVRFDYAKSYMYGKARITLKPHFYTTDTVTLDAKGMDIKEVSVVKGTAKQKLKYDYDGMFLRIKLDRSYKGGEAYTLYIDYTAKPDEFKAQGSAAISDAKGLYFINPRGEDKTKPTQIWTQGETEANSVWFPTIDKPNQKTTEEIYMTVPAKYVTLSNGLLISQKKNADGTRTDYWRMDQPHAPYLFFMGVGDYAIIKDSYKGKEVSYYVEREYAPVARRIFGETPRMIGLFSKLTGVDYPWPKYAQIVGRDYVSGAMENTTATLHQESAQQNARELIDGNDWEDVISHELFHQWFGDYVTAESWSNITVNESMADYSETLWNEYRYGKDYGNATIQANRESYLGNPNNAKKNLVRFYYKDKEDVFDSVSYPKGGAILHMLRNYVGDSAFFKSLNKYLTDNKYKAAEAQNLRLSFEEVTGQDLNWFWNQWYYGNGHPKLNINYGYENGKAMVYTEQTQEGNLFRLPVAIDIYNGSSKVRKTVWIENRKDTFTFNVSSRPDLVNVDADKILLVQKTDNKTAENFIHQFNNAQNFLDRREALDFFAKNKMAQLTSGLNDTFPKLRIYTLGKLNTTAASLLTADVLSTIESLVKNDPSRRVKAKAIEILGKQKNNKYIPLFAAMANDSSYTVAGNALEALAALDANAAYKLAVKLNTNAKGNLATAASKLIMSNGTEADFDAVYKIFTDGGLNQQKLAMTVPFSKYLMNVNDEAKFKKGLKAIMDLRNAVPEQYRQYTDGLFKSSLTGLANAKRQAGNTAIADYIQAQITTIK
ncbi:hypothetical protein BH09BAC2_BH09BAC2_16800 [soil metagenome]